MKATPNKTPPSRPPSQRPALDEVWEDFSTDPFSSGEVTLPDPPRRTAPFSKVASPSRLEMAPRPARPALPPQAGSTKASDGATGDGRAIGRLRAAPSAAPRPRASGLSQPTLPLETVARASRPPVAKPALRTLTAPPLRPAIKAPTTPPLRPAIKAPTTPPLRPAIKAPTTPPSARPAAQSLAAPALATPAPSSLAVSRPEEQALPWSSLLTPVPDSTASAATVISAEPVHSSAPLPLPPPPIAAPFVAPLAPIEEAAPALEAPSLPAYVSQARDPSAAPPPTESFPAASPSPFVAPAHFVETTEPTTIPEEPRRRPRRWMEALGAVAIALALLAAWQLRPRPAPLSMAPAPPSPVAAPSAPAPAAAERAMGGTPERTMPATAVTERESPPAATAGPSRYSASQRALVKRLLLGCKTHAPPAKILDVLSDSAWVHRALGACASAEGRRDDAVAQYRTALAADPKDSGAVFLLGRMLLQDGKAAEALSLYRGFLRQKPPRATAKKVQRLIASIEKKKPRLSQR